jgi:hypothetical protein
LTMVQAGFAAAASVGSFGFCGIVDSILLTRAVQQGSFGEPVAFGSFACEAGRFFLAGGPCMLSG